MPIDFPVLNFQAIAPELVVVVTAFLVMFAELFVDDKRILGYISILGLAMAAILNFALMAAFAPPTFQTMMISDGYSLILNLIFIIAAALSILISLSYLGDRELQHGEYYALLLFATVGMMLMGAATDLIIVFMGLEIMSIALYILAAFNRQQLGSGEAGMKYFVLGAFASAFFLYGVALVYGATGSTNLQEIGNWFSADRGNLGDPIALIGLSLLLVGFSFKIAAVPFQWWTPDVYQGAPTSVTAFMSVGAKAAGFAALMRVLMVSFGDAFTADWQLAVAVLAVITMTVGNIAALAQKDVKRMLAYSSIAHAGYILVGVVPGTIEGVQAVLFYLLSYTFMNIGAFAVIAVLERRSQVGSNIKDYAGLATRSPLLALAMMLFMISLTGIPPFIGFWGKLYVFRAAVEANMSWLAVVGMINSAISAFYYLGVVVQMYMRPVATEEDGDVAPALRISAPVVVTLVVTAIVTILFGVWPTPLVNLTSLAMFG
ncbi:MAG: NADH-quinone oxidoreductase subunit N [Anaerolineae bacterium]|nr:NADH-quinone oxidoreductase subunit N [Anaerolineae bacterium]MCB9105439.1 NADH-quinone oxidoreductase subunit N [Anaerolineales bacterium]